MLQAYSNELANNRVVMLLIEEDEEEAELIIWNKDNASKVAREFIDYKTAFNMSNQLEVLAEDFGYLNID